MIFQHGLVQTHIQTDKIQNIGFLVLTDQYMESPNT